jgi:hypothetical protein
VPFRFTGEIEKLVIDLKPTEAASAPERPDLSHRSSTSAAQVQEPQFQRRNAKKLNWSPVTPIDTTTPASQNLAGVVVSPAEL